MRVCDFTEHHAAVKALSWCPWDSNQIASGGGISDRRIIFWDVNNGSKIKELDTGSQVLFNFINLKCLCNLICTVISTLSNRFPVLSGTRITARSSLHMASAPILFTSGITITCRSSRISNVLSNLLLIAN